MKHISRRTFLTLTGVAALSVPAALSFPWFRDQVEQLRNREYQYLAALLPVGNDYLKQTAKSCANTLNSHGELIALAEKLDEWTLNAAFLGSAGRLRLHNNFDGLVQGEFTRGEVVLADNWVLSWSQCVICARLLTFYENA
jgi:hypothetical protein